MQLEGGWVLGYVWAVLGLVNGYGAGGWGTGGWDLRFDGGFKSWLLAAQNRRRVSVNFAL